MKQIKRALLSTAVLAGLYAGTANAGTEACFEVLKASTSTDALSVLDRWSTVYQNAGCVVTAGQPSVSLASFNPISVAYELTGNLVLNFNDVDGDTTADDLALPFYIPTTDLPGGSRIEVAIENARYANNGNQLHLIQVAKSTGSAVVDDQGLVANIRTVVTTTPVTYTFESVASSDGAVDRAGTFPNFTGGQVATFVTKAANTVGAGTRLFISRTSVNPSIVYNQVQTVITDETDPLNIVTLSDTTVTDPAVVNSYANLQPLNIGLNNEGCPAEPDVLLRATSARTDGGSRIIGGESVNNVANSVLTLVSAQPQFALFTTGTQSGPTVAEVNAEVPSLRTQFVASFDSGSWTPTKARPDFVWYTMGATNIGATLDRSVTLNPLDSVRIHAAATNSVGSTVRFDAYNTTGITPAALSTSLTRAQVFAGGVELDWSATANTVTTIEAISVPEFADPASAAARFLLANQVLPVANNTVQFSLENIDSEGVMNFNYDVNVRYGIDFVNPNYIDLAPTCNNPVKTHEIGVNGAVLKVPYTVEATGNFVRISNEHTSEAVITFDIFGEDPSLDASEKEVVNVDLGVLPPKSSVVYTISQLVALAKANNPNYSDSVYYEGSTVANGLASNGKRHFITFTVTAPKNKVHGVSVQKITGGVDRVIPVLDQNDWNQ